LQLPTSLAPFVGAAATYWMDNRALDGQGRNSLSHLVANFPITAPNHGERAMSENLSPIDTAKFVAAKRASEFVQDGMKVGLGTGSTAAWLVRCLGEMVREDGLRISGVPTSIRTAELARQVGINVISLDEARWLDITIDGTDEFDAELNLIKGGGGALLQEKIVATASDQMIVIADATKKVTTLGAFPLPIEVIPFGWQTTKALVEETLVGLDVLGNQANLRMNGDAAYVTDEGNHILDLHLNQIGNARQLSLILNQIPGVVENGLFIDICDIVVIGHGDGRVEVEDINAGTHEEERVDLVDTENIFREISE
jgi:ribose 5-phosphate isomerase A